MPASASTATSLGLTPQTDDGGGPYGKLGPPVGGAAVTLQDRAHFAQGAPAAAALTGSGGVRALVVLKVDSVDAIAAQVGAGAHDLLEEPRDQWGRLRVAHLTGPEGNLVELQEWLTPTV